MQAVDAYDAARLAFHGESPDIDGMSETNKRFIAPMIQAAIDAYLSASRSIPAAAAAPVIVCQECDCEQMLGGCLHCRAAQKAAGKSPHGARPVAEVPMREMLEGAAALLREAGWTVGEPKCETCKGNGFIAVAYQIPGVAPVRTITCTTCNGTGARKVDEPDQGP